jgi:hypothetical protein
MIRVPDIKKQAAMLREFFAEQGVTLTFRQSLDRVARLHGHPSWQVMEKHLRASSPKESTSEAEKFDASRQVAIFWDIGDVLSVRPDLTDDQCLEVLHKVKRNHDCERGINWSVIEQATNAYEGWTIDAEFCADDSTTWETRTIFLWNGQLICTTREEYLASPVNSDFEEENRDGTIRFAAFPKKSCLVEEGYLLAGEAEELAALCAELRDAGVANDGRERAKLSDTELECTHCGEVFDIEELDESECTWQQAQCPCCGSWEDRKRLAGS